MLHAWYHLDLQSVMCNLTASGAEVGNITLLRGDIKSQVPDHPACWEALKLAQESLPPSIFNHSFRVFLYTQALVDSPVPAVDAIGVSSILSVSVPSHVLFAACILHDIGTAKEHDSAPNRFEVVGADVAADILRSHGTDEQAIREAWLAIALHDSPHIAERVGGLVRAVRLGVRADFGSYPPPPVRSADVITEQLPRLEIEKDLGDAVVRQILERRDKAPGASWPGDLFRAKEANPEWNGINKGF